MLTLTDSFASSASRQFSRACFCRVLCYLGSSWLHRGLKEPSRKMVFKLLGSEHGPDPHIDIRTHWAWKYRQGWKHHQLQLSLRGGCWWAPVCVYLEGARNQAGAWLLEGDRREDKQKTEEGGRVLDAKVSLYSSASIAGRASMF